MADDDSCMLLSFRKRRRSFESELEEANHPPTKKSLTRELIVVDEDDTPAPSQGSGTQGDPIILGRWVTGNVIAEGMHDGCIVISDDDDDDDHVQQQETVIIDIDQSSPRPAFSGFLPISSPTRSAQSIAQNTILESTLAGFSVMPQAEKSCEQRADAPSEYNEHTSFWEKPEAESSSRTVSPRVAEYDTQQLNDFLETEETNECNDEDDDCIIVYEVSNSDHERQPWFFTIKDEEDDIAPCELTSSQVTQSTDTLVTPSSSQQISSIADPPPRLFESIRYTEDKELPSTPSLSENLTKPATWTHLSNKENDASIVKEQLQARKRLFWYTCWKLQRSKLKHQLQLYLQDVEGRRNSEDCWLYKGPKLSKTHHTLRVNVGFRHNGKLWKLSINLALIGLVLANQMTTEHKEGIINGAWHASHLCGNWTCLNPQHINPEPGPINLSRNRCFADRDGPCSHHPPCLKHLKVKLSTLRPPLEMAQLPDSQRIEFSSYNVQVPRSPDWF